MKINIEIDCTPDEFKQLFVPSEQQAEFAAKAYQSMAEAMQRAMLQQFSAFRPEKD